LDNLFDIAHVDALERIKIEQDKIFLQQQKGRLGCLAGVDKTLTGKEKRARQRKMAGEKNKLAHVSH